MARVNGKRLEARMRALGLTQEKLAQLVGVTQPTIGRLINGDSKETGKLPELATALHTSADFLVDASDDEGAIPERAVGLSDRQKPFKGVAAAVDPDLVQIAEIDLRYGMGGTFLDAPVAESFRQFSRTWLRQFTHAPPQQLVWAQGDGDSMEPTIRSGEMILIDRSNVTPRAGDGIWAFAWGDLGMVKRLRPLPDGTVEIHSDNPVVPPALASDGDLHVVGRVVAVVRRL